MSAEPPRPPVPPTERLRAPAAPREPRPPVAVAPEVAEPLPPELPGPGPWWESPWPAIATGVLGLLLGALLGYALHGSSSEPVRETNGAQAITRTVTRTVPNPVVRTNTVTSTTVKQTPPPAASAANEERRVEAETRLRKLERENEEFKRQQEEG